MGVFIAQNKNLPPPGSSTLQCNTNLLTYYPTGTRVTNYPITAALAVVNHDAQTLIHGSKFSFFAL